MDAHAQTVIAIIFMVFALITSYLEWKTYGIR